MMADESGIDPRYGVPRVSRSVRVLVVFACVAAGVVIAAWLACTTACRASRETTPQTAEAGTVAPASYRTDFGQWLSLREQVAWPDADH